VLVLLPAVTVLVELMLLPVRRNENADVKPCCWALMFGRWSTPSIVRFFEVVLAVDPVVDFPDLLLLLLVDPMEPVSSEEAGFAC
jgi:hypothetical protein